MFPLPPRRGSHGKAGLHDQRILAGVVVIASPPADDPKAERLIEGTGFQVGRPNLQGHHGRRSLAGPLQHAARARCAQYPAAGGSGCTAMLVMCSSSAISHRQT